MGNQRDPRYGYYQRTYIEGNTVRKLHDTQAVPQELPDDQREYRRPAPRRESSVRAREGQNARRAVKARTRRRAIQMNFGYVAFLTGAAAMSVFICVNFLQLQARNTSLQKEIINLESQYSELKLSNDDAYARAVSSVDLEEIRDIAINELGMVYAKEGQIITYDSETEDYVRQYEEVPQE